MADTPPVSGVGGISGDLPRNGGSAGRRPSGIRSRTGAKGTPPPGGDDDVAESLPDPTRSLVEALDRLRATEEPRPSETAVIRALRGAKYYQEESRFGLKALSDEPPAEDPGSVDRRG
jgi:hypothetical protein